MIAELKSIVEHECLPKERQRFDAAAESLQATSQIVERHTGEHVASRGEPLPRRHGLPQMR